MGYSLLMEVNQMMNENNDIHSMMESLPTLQMILLSLYGTGLSPVCWSIP